MCQICIPSIVVVNFFFCVHLRWVFFINTCKKSLKIPKGLSEVVNLRYQRGYRRRTDNKCQKKKNKETNNGLQNNTLKTKDRATRTPLKSDDDLSSVALEGFAVPAPYVTPVNLLLSVTNTNIIWYGNRVGHQYA